MLDISLATPAMVSAVSARLSRRISSLSVVAEEVLAQRADVHPRISSKIRSLIASSMTRVTSSSSYGMAGLARTSSRVSSLRT
jgi:DNA-directed RNA polymerase subunit F